MNFGNVSLSRGVENKKSVWNAHLDPVVHFPIIGQVSKCLRILYGKSLMYYSYHKNYANFVE